MYTELPPVPSPYHFILTLVTLVSPVLYPFTMVSTGALSPTMAYTGCW